MKIIPLLLVAALAATSLQAAPKKLLVVTTTTGFRHSSIPTSEKVLAELAKQSGAFTVDFVHQPEGKPANLKKDATAEEKAAFNTAETKWEETALKPALQKLSPAALKNYDAVAFVSTTGNLPIPDMAGFLNWIKSGGVFIGIHAASDTFHGSPEFIAMLGGEFPALAQRLTDLFQRLRLRHIVAETIGADLHGRAPGVFGQEHPLLGLLDVRTDDRWVG